MSPRKNKGDDIDPAIAAATVALLRYCVRESDTPAEMEQNLTAVTGALASFGTRAAKSHARHSTARCSFYVMQAYQTAESAGDLLTKLAQLCGKLDAIAGEPRAAAGEPVQVIEASPAAIFASLATQIQALQRAGDTDLQLTIKASPATGQDWERVAVAVEIKSAKAGVATARRILRDALGDDPRGVGVFFEVRGRYLHRTFARRWGHYDGGGS